MRVPDKELIIRILNYNDIRQKVEDGIKIAIANKHELLFSKDPYPTKPLNVVLEAIITQGWFQLGLLNKLNNILSKYNKRIGLSNGNVGFRDLDLLIDLCNNLSSSNKVWKEVADALSQLKNALVESGSLKNWADKLHEVTNKYIEGEISKQAWEYHPYRIRRLGFKGTCDVLKTLGYLDMVPIDRHEKRFQIRTGIALRYGPSGMSLEDDRFYIIALRRYCFENLRDVEILGESLGFSPGIVDWIIWHFSCEKAPGCKGICASNPKCSICPVKDLCYYYYLTRG